MTAFQKWINGLMGALISGGAAAATSGVVATAVSPQIINTQGGLHQLLMLMGTMFAVNGMIGALLYLKQHPTPWDGADRRNGNGGNGQTNGDSKPVALAAAAGAEAATVPAPEPVPAAPPTEGH